MSDVCWHCGADLTPPAKQQRGDWLFYTDLTLVYRDRQLRLPLHLRTVLYALFRTYPHPLSSEVVAQRLGNTARHSAVVYMSNIRRWFRDAGIPCPLGTKQNGIREAEYYWTG